MTDAYSNLPAGTFDGDPRAPWNESAPTCGDCSHLLEGCCDYGICELEFRAAFDETPPGTRLEAAEWALDWAVGHYKDMQEDACERCDG